MSSAEFTEQEPAVKWLRRGLEYGRLDHAHIFSGPCLADLEEVARRLAQTLNCRQPPQRGITGLPLEACGACWHCQQAAADSHPDVHWVRPESKLRVITIDQMRELMQVIHLKPFQGEYKVGILVAAERLNPQAANAFLKTLEEPPAKSILILLSTEPDRLMETIVSRCQRLHFGGRGQPQFGDEQLAWIRAFSGMAAGDSKGLLDRYRLLGDLLSRLATVRETIEKEWGSSAISDPAEAESGERPAREEEGLAVIEAEYRRQRAEWLASLQWWLRDVWLGTLNSPPEFLRFPALADTTQTVARRLSPGVAVENVRILEKTQRLLESNVQEGLTLEVGLLQLAL